VNSPSSNPLFGVRLIADVLGKSKQLVAASVLVGLLGFGVGLTQPEEYLYQGTVGIGLLFPKEPVESPMLVSMGMVDAGLSVVDYDLERGQIHAGVRPGRHRKNLGAIIDVSVRAKTASLAVAMFDKAVAKTLNTHQQARNFEAQIHIEHAESSSARADLLREEATQEGAIFAQSNEGLFIARKDAASAQALGLTFQAPPSSVLRREIEPVRRLSRGAVYCIMGLAAGGLLALLWILFAILIRETKEDSSQPSISRALHFCTENHRLIIACSLITGIAGVAMTSKNAGDSVGRTTLQMAHVTPYGSFRDLDSMKIEFKDFSEHLIEKKCGESCAIEIDIYSIRARLTPYSQTNIFQIRAKGADRALIKSILTETAEEFVKRQTPDYENAKRTLEDKIKALTGDIQRLTSIEGSRVDQPALIGFLREHSRYRRFLNPSRTHPARVLIPVHFEQSKSLRMVLIGTVFGLLGGAVLGVLAALGFAGWRFHRAR